MVVINTKKIFITILVSALLLVGSALTVFALESDFEFSAPNYNDSDIYFLDYEGYGYMMYNYINIDDDEQRYFRYVGSFMAFYNYETIDNTKKYHLSLSEYGFDFLSQNGSNAQSMKAVLEDFIDGNVGNITALFGKFSPVDYYILDSGEILLKQDYQDNPQFFDVISDLNNQFFNYESQYNNLLSQYQQLLQDYQNLQTMNNDLQAAINTLVSDNGALNAQLAELQNQYNSLETRYNDLQTAYDDLVDFYSDELTRLLNENNELRTFLQNADTQINNLEYEINRLRQANAEEYMRGYTQAIEDNDLFAEGLYSIFSAPFALVAEIAEIELFGTSIVKIVGIVLLFVVLSIVLGFLWKILPLV